MADERNTSTIFGTLLLVAALLSILVGERIFGLGPIRDVLVYGGGAALAASALLRVVTWHRSRGDVRGAEARLLGCYLGVVAALGGYALSTDVGLALMGLGEGAAERAAGVLSVLWPAAMLVSLSGLLFVELVYLRMPVTSSVELRRVRGSLHAGLSLALSAVFVLSLNYVAAERDVRRDVSYFETTRPSASTLELLDRLQAPLRVVLFFQAGNDVASRIEPYFAELAGHSDRVRYEVRDVAMAPELAREHRVRANGHVLLLREEPAGSPPQGKGSEGQGAEARDGEPRVRGESFRVGTELTRARATLRTLDGSFQEAFRKLVQPERRVHLTVGHGEHNARTEEGAAPEGVNVLKAVLARLNVQTEDLGVGSGLGSAVPDGAGAVLVVGPQQPFMPEEAQALLEYVRAGGRLMLMLDPDRDVGLSPLLSGLGLSVPPGVLASERDHMRRTATPADRAIVFSNRYSSHPVVTTASRHQREVATLFYRGGALDKAKATGEPAPRVTFPLRSDAAFWLDTDGDFEQDEGERSGAQNMIAAVTVKGEASEGAEPVEGRAVVIADGDFITDRLARNNGNGLLFVDALAWLIGNEELGGEVASEEDVPIEHSREEDRLWFYGTVFAVPGPVLAVGLLVARRRRRRAEGQT